MSAKKPIGPIWTTTVDPSEYDYVAQFTRMVKLANRHQECYAPVDVGKVWGLVQSHQRLEFENATLLKYMMQIADPEHHHFINRMDTARIALVAVGKLKP